MFEIPVDEQLENKENFVPYQHTPLADHYPLSDFASEEKPATDMYTLETRYQPSSAKALPRTNDLQVYHLDSDRRTPTPMQSARTDAIQTAFLQPKVVSQPVFYSVGNTKTGHVPLEQAMPTNYEPTPATVYSIDGRPRRPTVDMSASNLEVPNQANNSVPTIYSITGSPRMINTNEEPPGNEYLQPSANLYSLIGSPARTSRGTQVNTLDPNQAAPVLYTIMGDAPMPTNRLNEKDAMVYTLGDQTHTMQEQSMQKPSVYALMDRSYSPSQEKRTKRPATKNTASSPVTIPTERSSRSLERKPEMTNDEIRSYPETKPKQQTFPRESRFPKSQTTIIPVQGESHRTRPAPSFQTKPKPYSTVQYPPIQLPDYRSPYAVRTHKAYRERNFNNNALPLIAQSHSDRRSRPALYEPRYRSEKHHPYNSTKQTSLERYPVNTKPRSSLWDNGYQTQTDDDEDYGQRTNRKKQNFKTSRPRAPWIPVW